MKKRVLIICMIALHFSYAANAQPLENIYTKSFIGDLIHKVNDYQLKNPWKEFDDNWIRGTYYTGVMAAYQATGDQKLLDQVNALGEKLNWQLPAIEPNHGSSGLNLLTVGQIWMESYMIDQKKHKIEHIIAHLEHPDIKNPVANPLQWHYESGRRYVDGIYTGPPALAMLYHITGELKYLHWMDACFWDIYGALWDNEERLFYRDIRFMPGYAGVVPERFTLPDTVFYHEARAAHVYQKTAHGKKVLWSRGNGWAHAGLARILKYLPKDNANYEAYRQVFVNLAEELKERQQTDGFWYPNLADPMDYGSKESSGTAFFTYSIAWGINNAILSKEEYLPIVQKAWEGLASIVSDEDKVQWGQLVAPSPYKVIEEDSHEYVSGMFLLAASEMYKMEH
jgi:unsaturated rhamnogalacturonyl hydrolase